jgi:hypothetical protein
VLAEALQILVDQFCLLHLRTSVIKSQTHVVAEEDSKYPTSIAELAETCHGKILEVGKDYVKFSEMYEEGTAVTYIPINAIAKVQLPIVKKSSVRDN